MNAQLRSFDSLLVKAREMVSKRRPIRVAVLGISDDLPLKAVLRARKEGLISPLILGSQENIEKIGKKAGLDISKLAILNCKDPGDETVMAIRLIGDSQVEMLFVADFENTDILKALFDKSSGFRDGKNTVSHVAVFEHDDYPRLLLMSDGAVNVAPDINKKLKIIDNVVGVAGMLGVEKPRVAMLAAVEVIYPAMPVTTEGAIISKMADRGQIKNCLIDGPLSWDVATVPKVAEQKGAISEVAGQADIVIAPNIETGNGIYKAMSMFVRAKTAGMIVGGKIPLAVSSRCDSADNNFYSFVLGCFAVLNKNQVGC